MPLHDRMLPSGMSETRKRVSTSALPAICLSLSLWSSLVGDAHPLVPLVLTRSATAAAPEEPAPGDDPAAGPTEVDEPAEKSGALMEERLSGGGEAAAAGEETGEPASAGAESAAAEESPEAAAEARQRRPTVGRSDKVEAGPHPRHEQRRNQ